MFSIYCKLPVFINFFLDRDPFSAFFLLSPKHQFGQSIFKVNVTTATATKLFKYRRMLFCSLIFDDDLLEIGAADGAFIYHSCVVCSFLFDEHIDNTVDVSSIVWCKYLVRLHYTWMVFGIYDDTSENGKHNHSRHCV